MKKLHIDLKNCYGIKGIEYDFDFSQSNTFLVYAPNGIMKSSFARTFSDIANNRISKDIIYPNRICTRIVINETTNEISPEEICVFEPYDESFSHSEKTSTLLVNSNLRKEYENLHKELNSLKESFISLVKKKSLSKRDMEKEILRVFSDEDGNFFEVLIVISQELPNLELSELSNVQYDVVFDEKVLEFLNTKDFKIAIKTYIEKYNELLATSEYFKKSLFTYYNAENISKNLSTNGFFNANHSLVLNSKNTKEIRNQKELDELIKLEKERISGDPQLRRKFEEIEKLITKNVTLRDFWQYIQVNEFILPYLSNIENFQKNVLRSYIHAQENNLTNLISQYKLIQVRQLEIEKIASLQKTQWEEVIEIFNNRFIVPFKLIAKNKISVILGQESLLLLDFIFEDGEETTPVKKEDLMKALSTGEKKALYILNIIFEVEARKKANQQSLFIFDDIADSFDYKNKYAIIQYLQDIDEEIDFKQILLTHNFDFFRTLESRFVKYSNCLMVNKSAEGITLEQAVGIRNIFVNNWKMQFLTNNRKKIASIPFLRNIIEYTKGDEDENYKKLTSLLHWKNNTAQITVEETDEIFKMLFSSSTPVIHNESKIFNLICHEADLCLSENSGINLENKVILSIAIRLIAEKYLVENINNNDFCDSINKNQTHKLFKEYSRLFSGNTREISIIKKVILMTPENIHLNSFMYEPIIDMSDDHLKKLYTEVKDL